MTKATIGNTELLCLGRVETLDSKRLTRYKILTGEHAGKTMAFDKQKPREKNPGGIYLTTLRINESGEPAGYTDGLKLVRTLEDLQERANLQMRSELVERQEALETHAKKFNFDELCPGFQNLREIYAKTNPAGRAALTARVIDELRKW